MDWVEFFEKTRLAAGVESFAKLAPKLGISDGAISHYRTGKRVPQVWVVAECLKLQGHPQPEKAAIQIMKSEAQTSPERSFWKRLAATAMTLALGVSLALPVRAEAAANAFKATPNYTLCEISSWGCTGAAPLDLALDQILLIAAEEMPPFPQTYTPFAAETRGQRTLACSYAALPMLFLRTHK
ncbi:DUF3693 domain-containing protein [Xanthomonas campestris pv. asclepiadis]|uniref:DUF3693 domain-containing protein n=1 Tax=Xanthomonas campestris TaxID=339 RepID=UPI001E2B9173|nr:DUF3693 domain-containing protein [Xanthomonas campestris]MCC4615618.1 DUF3693 domain-containing protein [Xanthomonas campestris pv. asclepiadis]